MPSNLRIEEKYAVKKKPRGKFRIALVYPSSYRVAISNLGYRIIYHMLNMDDRIYCERFVYEYDRSLESGSCLREFDLIMFSYHYEPDLIRIAEIILKNDLFNKPKVVGGPCTYNPYPLRYLADYVYIGEAESKLQDFVYAMMDGADDEEIANMEGLYVSRISNKTVRTYPRTLDTFLPSRQVSSSLSVFGDALLVDVSRGCKWGCLFCLGRSIYYPYRERSIDQLTQVIDDGMMNAGYSSLTMIASDLISYSRLSDLINCIDNLLRHRRFRVIAPSLRADMVDEDLLNLLVKSGERTITIAPESSEQLRCKIGKRFSDQDLMESCKLIKKSGIKNVKLYFMIGLPDETMEDIKSIAQIVKDISKIGLNVKVNVNLFVPKPFTPLQDAELEDPKEFSKKLKFLRREIGSSLTTDGFKQAYLQAVIGRGGEEIGKIILNLLRKHGRFSLSFLRREMKEAGLDIDDYVRKGSTSILWKEIRMY